MKLMYTIKDASVLTGLSYSAIYLLVSSGEVKSFRSGKKYYVNMPSLCEKLGIEFVLDSEVV